MLPVKPSLLTKESFYEACLNLGLNHNLTSTLNPNLNNQNNINNKIQNIWVGFSGGLDSRVLLELSYLTFSNNTNYKLRAVHINHSVNKNADLWQEHCYTVCKNLNIEFQANKITVSNDQISKFGSLEAALRFCRMDAWQTLLSSGDILLLAHHLNDQAETVFLRLLRGTGLKGLAAIRPATMFGKIQLMRPLLNNSRQDIEDFAQKHKLVYVQDDSNLDPKFTRNFLRLAVFPKFINNWPKFINNIGRTVKHLQQTDLFIVKQARAALLNCYAYDNYNVKYLQKNNINKNILLISKLLQYDSFLQTEILREWIVNHGFYPPDENKLNKIYTEVISAGIDRQPKLNLRQYIICRYRDKLYVYPANYFKQKKPSFKNIIGDLEIYVGDSISVVGIVQAKKIFQKFGIPPWHRHDYQLVFWRKELIAIIGLWFKKV